MYAHRFEMTLKEMIEEARVMAETPERSTARGDDDAETSSKGN